MDDDENYRKMWADYWTLREDFIQKFKDDFPESEFIQHALNSDFYPSCLEKPPPSTKRPGTETEPEKTEEPQEKKRKGNTSNEENCILFRPKSTLEHENNKNSVLNDVNSVLKDKNSVLKDKNPVLNDENPLQNDKNPAQNSNLNPDTHGPENCRKTHSLSLVAQFISNYSSFKLASFLTLKQKVTLALRNCDFPYNLFNYTMEGIHGKPQTTCELYFQHFLVSIGRGNDRKMAEEAALEELTRTMEDYQRVGSWNFSRPVKLIDIEDAHTTKLLSTRFLPKLMQVGEIIKENKSHVLDPKTLLNEAFRKSHLEIVWKCSFRSKNRVVCDLIGMIKFRLSWGAGQNEADAASKAADVFVGKVDALLLDKLRTRVSEFDFLTQENAVGSAGNPFVLWEKSYLGFQTEYSILYESAERNGRELRFRVGRNICDVILDKEMIISTFRMQSTSSQILETCAATETLRQLRKTCYTIRQKLENLGLTIRKDDLSSETTVDNICHKITHIYSEDQTVTERPNSCGVQANMADGGYLKLFSNRIFKILDVYNRAECLKDLIFSTEFSPKEKSIICRISREMRLLCWTNKNEYGFYSVVEKRLNCQVFLDSPTNLPTEKFDLIPPG